MIRDTSNLGMSIINRLSNEEMTAKRQENLDMFMYNGLLSNDISITYLAVTLGAQVNYNHVKYACKHGYWEIAKIFLEFCNCTNIMQSACASGDIEVVRFLIDNDVKVSQLDLELAIIGGHTEVVKSVFTVIPKPTPIDNYVFIIAYKMGFREITNILSQNKMYISNYGSNPD